MRKAALTAAALLFASALAIWFWRLSPFLPERGGATCFAAEYNPPRPMNGHTAVDLAVVMTGATACVSRPA